MKQPNILFMISHDTGRHLGCYGEQVKSPTLDKMAQDGVRFDKFYCPAPQCSPSRGSILTGKYPHNNGLIGLAHYEFSLDENVKTMPMLFGEGGYDTSLIGFSHETIGQEERGTWSSRTKLGYDNFIEVEGSRAPDVARSTINFLKQQAESDDKKPFFANVGFWETHRKFEEYEPYADDPDTVHVPDYLPDTPSIRKEISLLNGSVKVMDDSIQQILQGLEESGLKENTIVIFTTDHGIAFPRAKGTMKEAGLETALIMSGPSWLSQGSVRKELLCNVDLLPTLLELGGIEVKDDFDGKSFAKLLQTNEEETIRDDFFFEMTWHDDYHPMRGIRTAHYSYVKNFEDGPKVYIPMDIHSSISGKDVREQYFVPNDAEELYDLEADPFEENNLIHSREHQQIAFELRERVEKWMKETNDPLLNGPVNGIASAKWAVEKKEGRAYLDRSTFESNKG
ncbi:sulfatase family protein [Terribacillus saccharophilus]|uniref:sulfatase family protein n=1 Tax=Terribacillus saccharophilus TaxID=361277 RepID=UPI002DC88A03|nr:sulfatase [Terribacillus saccharophilus]MEC0289463.1 sulfatase [Terribacillus saccharophilus]